MAQYCVYKHTTPNEKVYIGITGRKPLDRWDSGHGYRQHKYFWNAIQKYGWNNIKHEVLYDGLTKEDACRIEIETIEAYRSRDRKFGYNLSSGGDGGSKGITLSTETRQKMSISRKGKKHPFYGKHHSQATKEKLRRKLSGENHPQFNTHRSDETKRKLRGANSGENHPMFGKTHPEEIKKKIRESVTKSIGKGVVCIDTGMAYISASEASRTTGANTSHILACCRKDRHRKTAGGYRWSFSLEERDER